MTSSSPPARKKWLGSRTVNELSVRKCRELRQDYQNGTVGARPPRPGETLMVSSWAARQPVHLLSVFQPQHNRQISWRAFHLTIESVESRAVAFAGIRSPLPPIGCSLQRHRGVHRQHTRAPNIHLSSLSALPCYWHCTATPQSYAAPSEEASSPGKSTVYARLLFTASALPATASVALAPAINTPHQQRLPL